MLHACASGQGTDMGDVNGIDAENGTYMICSPGGGGCLVERWLWQSGQKRECRVPIASEGCGWIRTVRHCVRIESASLRARGLCATMHFSAVPRPWSYAAPSFPCSGSNSGPIQQELRYQRALTRKTNRHRSSQSERKNFSVRRSATPLRSAGPS